MNYTHLLMASILFCSPIIAMEAPAKKLKLEQENTELGEQLIAASRGRNLSQVRALLCAGAPVNYADYYGSTALIWASAACEDNAAVVRVLIDAGANVNYKNKALLDVRALSAAIAHRQVEIVSMLINAGARVFCNGKHLDRSRFLQSAAFFGPNRTCELIAEKMASMPSEDQKMRLYTVMHCFKRMYRLEYPNLRNLFKTYLRTMFKEENFADPNSFVRKEIDSIKNNPGYDDPSYDKSEKRKEYLLERYCY